jgi:hypothetical protein
MLTSTQKGGNMTRHLSLLFLLVILVTTSCQPSANAIQTAAAQTQAVQSAFEAAVLAAQTQAAPPTASPMPTLQPSPTPVEASSVPATTEPTGQPNLPLVVFMNLKLQEIARNTSEPLDARVVSMDYLRDGTDNPVHLGVGAIKGASTQSGHVYAGILLSLRGLDGTSADGIPVFPSTLKTFKITIYDERLTKVAALSGNWSDLVAWKYGSLTDDQFTKRLLYE